MAASSVDKNWIVVLGDGTYATVSEVVLLELTPNGHEYVEYAGNADYMNSSHYRQKVKLSDAIEAHLKTKRGG